MSNLETWKTADGKYIIIKDMEDEHLINAFKYVVNRIEYLTADHMKIPSKWIKYWNIFKQEMDDRGLNEFFDQLGSNYKGETYQKLSKLGIKNESI